MLKYILSHNRNNIKMLAVKFNYSSTLESRNEPKVATCKDDISWTPCCYNLKLIISNSYCPAVSSCTTQTTYFNPTTNNDTNQQGGSGSVVSERSLDPELRSKHIKNGSFLPRKVAHHHATARIWPNLIHFLQVFSLIIFKRESRSEYALYEASWIRIGAQCGSDPIRNQTLTKSTTFYTHITCSTIGNSKISADI